MTLDLVKRLTVDDFCDGQIYIYNFDRTPYISTLKEDFYKSEQGRKIISLIKYYKPDFYTELHSYNISHFMHYAVQSLLLFDEGILPDMTYARLWNFLQSEEMIGN